LARDLPGIGQDLTREQLEFALRALSTAEAALSEKMESLEKEREQERKERIRRGTPTLEAAPLGSYEEEGAAAAR
jgi:hypothetical protein